MQQPSSSPAAPTIRFWGTRGGRKVSEQAFEAFGKETTCVEIELPDCILLLDGGTGFLDFSNDYAGRPQEQQKPLRIFISHMHLDHIQGLEQAPIMFNPKVEKVLAGFRLQWFGEKAIPAGNFADAYQQLFSEPYSPGLAQEHMQTGKAKIIDLTSSVNKKLDMGNGYQLSFCPLPHGKIVSMGVKIQHGESSWCVLTDLSLRTDDNQKTPHFKRIAEFCRGAELLIADATYDHQDFEAKPFLLGYGHSAAEDVMAMAAASGVKALVLAHHDPMLCDEALTNRASRITQFAKDQGFGFQPRLAQPGLWQPNSPPANLRPQNTREVA